MHVHSRRSFGLAGLGLSVASPRFRSARQSSSSTWFDRWCLEAIARAVRGAPLRIVLWDGTWRSASDASPLHEIRVGSRFALWRLLPDPDLGFGEGFVRGDVRVQGDLYALVDAVATALASNRGGLSRIRRRLAHWAGASLAAARRNAHHHYDLGNEFYRLWLDDQLVYTCAYFATPDASLEAAQAAKLERVCEKLDLRPGMRVCEAGCGWGALACHMARSRAVDVHAWNVSHEQVVEARSRVHEQGLDSRVTIVEDDWRRISGACDAFVSVGMLEHVGAARYRELGAVIDRCLDRAHGRGLLHFIGRDVEAPGSRWTRRYIFPGFYLPTLREVLGGVIEPYGFSVIDVENLRRHYARTLEHWRDRFERVAPLVARRYGEAFVRTWRYYLAGAHAGFAAGYLQLFQVTFARESWTSGPWRRVA